MVEPDPPLARGLSTHAIPSRHGCLGRSDPRRHDPGRVQLTFEQRLLRLLAREERDEQRSHRELRAQPIDARVLEGECLRDAEFVAGRDGSYLFAVPDNASKLRPGDPVVVGDGLDLDRAEPLQCGEYDAAAGRLRLVRDPWLRDRNPQFVVGRRYVVDRRPLGLRGRLATAVQTAFAMPRLSQVLLGDHTPGHDPARTERARAALAAAGLDPAQVEAGALAIGTESLQLVQGPPGTGKTRLLAEVVRLLAGAGCRIALCAFTHRAVDNALHAVRRLAPQLPLFKLDSGSSDSRAELLAARVQLVDARRGRLPERGCVVAGTCFQLDKLPDDAQCHYTVFDEAGQLPIPHALPGMLRAQRWLFFGDHQQLPPVVTTAAADPAAAQSVFEHLHRHYGGALLDRTYRMNDGVCRVVSDAFYGGAVHPAPGAALRRMPFVPGGRLDEVLDPAVPVAWLRIDHHQPGLRSHEEAQAVADLVADLLVRHRIPPAEVAVIAPFRGQVRLLRSAVEQRQLADAGLVVDTVDRIQGQEREVVIVSLTVGDANEVRARGAFHLSTQRLNVALSRARTKAVLVASRHAFSCLPHDPESLRMAARCRSLAAALPQFDFTAVYANC